MPMSDTKQAHTPEPWLRGPVEGIELWLQPVAHALVQVREDVARAVAGLDRETLVARPGGAASLAFHLRHIPGSIDRLMTYAGGASLDEAQKAALAAEKEETADDPEALVEAFERALSAALERLRRFPAASLLEPRAVGRAGLPSTVLGLLFHSAEHAQRHTGQVIVTAKLVRINAPVQDLTPYGQYGSRERR
jgi:uncharacterized damage-inducible protein DinB